MLPISLEVAKKLKLEISNWLNTTLLVMDGRQIIIFIFIKCF